MFKLIIPFLLLSVGLFGESFILKNSRIINSEVVKMKDVLLSEKGNLGNIGELIIAVSPPPGKSITISASEIKAKLAGNGVANPTIKGHRSIIKRGGDIITPDFFKPMITSYIKKNSKWKHNIDVKINSSKKLIIPTKNVKWKIYPANGNDFFGNVLFKAKAYRNGEEIFSTWIVSRLKITRKVAVTTQRIYKGREINQACVRWEEREITPFTKNAVFNEQFLYGKKAGRNIMPNSVVTSELLQRQYLVRRNTNVTLSIKFKNISATTKVKALGNGTMGDSVRVINLASRKIISGVVTGRNRLEVNPQ